VSTAKPPSAYYERHLPHWQPEHTALFITWRLHGSLPGGWTGSYPRAQKQLSEKRTKISPGVQFRAADARLDRATSGPLWLKDPRVAECVEESILFAESDLQLYRLDAWVVMANHVHLLIKPAAALGRITKTLKGFTARKANALLGRTGRPFWQDESFDHWVRDDVEFARVVSYIERNPVMAGLVRYPKDWPWSSAHR
jgi:REP element-mobilizing transposase RayT